MFFAALRELRGAVEKGRAEPPLQIARCRPWWEGRGGRKNIIPRLVAPQRESAYLRRGRAKGHQESQTTMSGYQCFIESAVIWWRALRRQICAVDDRRTPEEPRSKSEYQSSTCIGLVEDPADSGSPPKDGTTQRSGEKKRNKKESNRERDRREEPPQAPTEQVRAITSDKENDILCLTERTSGETLRNGLAEAAFRSLAGSGFCRK